MAQPINFDVEKSYSKKRILKSHNLIKSIMDKRSIVEKQILQKRLPELLELERILLNTEVGILVTCCEMIECHGLQLPIYKIEFGQFSPQQPHLLIVGGVHGIERIGSRVVIAVMSTWLQRLQWDVSLLKGFQMMSATFIPIANPGGMFLNHRSNARGVDLMRNAPIDAEGKVPFLVGGQRLSPFFSWYRGSVGVFEKENQVLEAEVKRLCHQTPLLISLDCHSGFGFRDRLWFPYAYRRRPLNDIAPIMALKLLWESNYPHHNYIFEPQSNNYLTHGDIWDYFYKRYGRAKNDALQVLQQPSQSKPQESLHHSMNVEKNRIQKKRENDQSFEYSQSCFLPLTLEMGSWNWVKKRPSQLLSFHGFFNPLVRHREKRVLRTHLPFLDFLRHAVMSHEHWLPTADNTEQLKQMATSIWYRDL